MHGQGLRIQLQWFACLLNSLQAYVDDLGFCIDDEASTLREMWYAQILIMKHNIDPCDTQGPPCHKYSTD
jgi:hypothetical protein